MSKQLLAALAAGLVVIGVALFSTVSINQGHLLTLTGSITDVHIAELSPDATLVVVDFTAANPSAVGFEVKELALERVDGGTGDLLSKSDATRYLEYNKLSQLAPFGIGDRIKGGETVQRLVIARFDAPAAGFAAATYRIRFRHIENVDAQIEGRKSQARP
jgi:hypothetical protein